MSDGGYPLIVPDSERQNRIGERIGTDTYFTDAVPADRWQGRNREIALVSLDGKMISGICLAKRGQKVATFKVRLKFSQFASIDAPIPFDEIQSLLDNRIQQYFLRVTIASEGGWITPATWNEVIRVISEIRTDTVTIFEELNALLNMRQQNYSAQIYDTLNDEKDAYASIIRFAGFQSVADSTVLSKLLPEK